jgi:hypothetical protein
MKIVRTLPEFIDPFFTKTSPKRSFSMSENENFGLVFAKTRSINLGTGDFIMHLEHREVRKVLAH